MASSDEEGSGFSSMATTLSGFYQDLTDFALGKRHAEGTVAPSCGVTKPINRDSIRSLDDIMSLTKGWTDEFKANKGSAAYDMFDTHPDDSYRQRRYEFLNESEGTRTRAYDDVTGQPIAPGSKIKGNVTVGLGFNMDADGNREQFKAATGLSDDDFDAVRSGKKTLNQEQVRKLFDYTAREAESIVNKRLEGVPLEEHQRLALVSLAFNNPELIGPKLVTYIKAGDFDKAREEILYRSNADKVRGLASRRYREAAMFSGNVDAQASLPKFADYIRNFA